MWLADLGPRTAQAYDSDPQSLDREEQVSLWVKTNDDESFEHARQPIRLEILLCGGSCSAAMSGAVRFPKEGGEGWERFRSQHGKNVVVILPDRFGEGHGSPVRELFFFFASVLGRVACARFCLFFFFFFFFFHFAFFPRQHL